MKKSILLTVLALAFLTSSVTHAIIGGERVDANDPISRSIVYLFDKVGSTSCTGTILSEDLIVTAAHCMTNGAAAQVILFGTEIALTDEGLARVPNRSAIASVIYPRYVDTLTRTNAYYQSLKAQTFDKAVIKAALLDFLDHNPDNGDLALVRFSGGLPAGYRPAKILPANFHLQFDQRITLAGYGMTKSPSQQTEADKSAPDVLEQTDVTIQDVTFGQTEVVLNQTQDRGACHGDSGGPAFIKAGGELYTWGATSRGIQDPANACRSFAVYTNLLPYRAWFAQAADQMGTHLDIQN